MVIITEFTTNYYYHPHIDAQDVPDRNLLDLSTSGTFRREHADAEEEVGEAVPVTTTKLHTLF